MLVLQSELMLVLQSFYFIKIPITGQIQRSSIYAERFKPGEQSYPPFAYLPFGEGPHTVHSCTGKRLALLKAKMALVSILKDFSSGEL